MKDKKEIARLIYQTLKTSSIDVVLDVIANELEKGKTDKLKITRTPLINGIGQELGRLLHKDEERFKMLMSLWKEGKRDERLIVISALGFISKKEYNSTKAFVYKILKDVSQWEICDQLSLKVIVHLVVQNEEEMFSVMEEWVKSENKWLRRLAVATIPPYIRARSMSWERCLKFLERVMHERDKDVKKAVGWALREITKKKPEAVFQFLKKWADTDDKNTRWMIREGMKKLSDEQQTELTSLIKR